ncbi:MAG TPA: thiamine phosphate synthase [Candidatus Angelobacter sp.]|nr:thiamine phosphate synthase [Candidatus Angelobacter sp.]
MCNPAQPAYSPSKRPVLLYYITDRTQFAGNATEQQKNLLERIAECAHAEVDYIQLREKDLTTRELEQLARQAMAAIPAGSSTRLLINSRLDVALACGAHGVHLPANNLSASEARAIFARAGHAHPIIGVSTHSAAEAAAAESHGADFAVFGAVFEKSGRTNPGGFEQLAAATHGAMPVLALGGVSLQNAEQCLWAGAAGIAGIRIFQQGEVSATVKMLRRLQAAPTSAGL